MDDEGHSTPLPHCCFKADSTDLELWVLPEDRDASKRIIELIRSAKKTIQVAMFTWTRPGLHRRTHRRSTTRSESRSSHRPELRQRCKLQNRQTIEEREHSRPIKFGTRTPSPQIPLYRSKYIGKRVRQLDPLRLQRQ